MNIYVGNLSTDVTEEEIQELFGKIGEVVSVKLITDRFTGEPRGFGFVEMKTNQESLAAIEELDGKEVKGKNLIVNKAREKSRGNDRRGGRGGNRSGGGGFNRRSRY